MALKLPKQYHPDFARPGVKPTGNVEIDWSNPLARGLRHCIVQTGRRDLVSGHVHPGIAVTYDAARGVVLDGSAFSRLDYNTGVNAPAELSVYCSASYDSITADATLIDVNNIDFLIWADTYGGKLRPAIFAGLAVYGTDVGFSPSSSSEYVKWGGRANAAANTGALFVDGKVSVADTSIGTRAWESSANIAFGGQYNYSRLMSGAFEFIFMWDRELSDAEFAAINDDPYQILKPAQPMMLFTSAGGGGPSTQTLLVSSIVTGEAFGQPGVSFSALSIAMSAIASGEAVGQVTIDTSRSVGLSAIPSLEAFGLYNVTTGAVTVSTLGIASGEASGLISIASGTYVNPVGVSSGEALGQISVQALSVDILPMGVGSLEAFGLPEVPREAVTITVQPANYGEVMGEPLILVGDVTVAVNSASAGESMGQPEVKLAQMFIRPEGIYSGMMFGRIAIVGGDFVYVASDYAVISPVVKSVVESVVTGLAA